MQNVNQRSKPNSTKVRRFSIGSALLYGVVALGALLTISPFVWMVLASFKQTSEMFRYPPSLLPDKLDLSNYQQLIFKRPFLPWYSNSVFLALVSVLVVMFFCSLAGFGFAKYQFPGRAILFGILLSSTMIPFQLILIPLFIFITRLGWVDTYPALIVPFMAPAFGIFLMKQFMGGIPNDLLDAARIDGSSEFGVYFRVVLPLLRPAFAVLSLTTFLGSWNNFLWPLVVLRTEAKLTLPVGLAALSALGGGTAGGGSQETKFGIIMAAATLVAIPVMLIFLGLQKQFIAGLTIGSVKG